ncbi:hypothetical protein QBC33DRAFT_562193 [Phialemonium atrogriseum]|uniref:Uncharacterized protein n=1 Tax=Phialemonium atrogriseum TaxID=1093897 RepID=A0AAJ0BTD6_9PEZI|nr:uncharacterized protein QBC33DRAFT_562193 [Phialemonium atrogriseum]KAK1764139.1 hypothetical protein QBC33DRAFT_562193 [Phialemonium atrogriseum]
MPFFSRHSEPVEEEPQPEPLRVEEERPKRHGLFGSRHRSPSPTPSRATQATNNTNRLSTASHSSTSDHNGGGGIFRRSTEASNGHRSLLHRTFGNGNDSEIDPSILQARERVSGAEAAERDADRALAAARQSVREAHEHVRRLELEAEEEARLARIKQHHAREVSKRGKQLGRHGL